MTTDARARWAAELAPIIAGRVGRCADCGALILARPSKRYPRGKTPPKRCPDCARDHHNARCRAYKHAHPERARAQKAAWHARRGTVYVSPTARYDDEGHRICEECPTRLVRVSAQGRWPKRCPDCTRAARRAGNRERKRRFAARQKEARCATDQTPASLTSRKPTSPSVSSEEPARPADAARQTRRRSLERAA